MIKFNYLQTITFILFSLFTIFWISINFFGIASDEGKTIFSGVYGIMALWGGVVGVTIANKWGLSKSIIGTGLLLFSIGLLFQELGQLSYAYYINILKYEEAPYPSLGDVFFLTSTPLYAYGTWLLVKTTGGKKAFHNKTINKIIVIILPLIIVVFSYLLFLNHYEFDWNNPLLIFFDIGYPFGQAIYISIALVAFLLSKKYLGGYLKFPILIIIIALILQYIADYQFTYEYSHNTWEPGELNEYVYFLAYFVMTLGLIQFNNVLEKLKVGEPKPTQVENVSVPIQNSEVTVQ